MPRTHPAALTLILLAVIACTGCESVQKALESLDKPTARIQDVRLRDLTLQNVTLHFDVEVSNPYKVDLPLTRVDYALATTGKSFLDGEADLSGTIPARGSRTVTLPASIRFEELIQAVKDVRLGQVLPYKADLALSVDGSAVPGIPGGGTIRLPVSKQGKLPVPNVPKVELTDVRWSKLDLTEASAVIQLRVENTNEFPVDLSSLGYQLSLGDTLVADTTIDKSINFAPGKAQTIELPLRVAPANLGLALLRTLTQGSAKYDLSGSMSGQTPFGPIDLPFNRAGTTKMGR